MSNDKIDLGSEGHLEMTMTHEVKHFNHFDDTYLCGHLETLEC